MNRKLMKLLCCLAVLMMLTACRSGGGETKPVETVLPSVPATTLPDGEGVEEWIQPDETEPAVTEEPAVENTETPEETTEPADIGEEPVVTVPAETEPKPTEAPVETQPQTGGRGPADVTYEEYLAMSPYEQQAHYEQFASLEAYIAWHNAALAEYEENQTSIEVTGGIDIGDFINP